MIREEAKKIIKDTFENSFNKQKFSYFIKNLLKDGFETKDKDFSRFGVNIKTAFRDQIKKFERIGKFTDNNGNIIDVLTVELIHANSVERARTTQRNFIRWYLNGSMGDQLKDAALVAFYHPETEDWRFSFIKMQYSLERKKDDFTPAKRYSYLVGKSEHSHTAQIQLIDLLRTNEIPTLEQLENSFSIEKVTKRFFDEYKELFLTLKETIDKTLAKDKTIKSEFEVKQIDTAAFAKKTLGQIVFLYFLQKKGWLGVPAGKSYGQGDKRFLQTLFEKCQQKGQNFFNEHLKFLFYDALAIERPATDKTEKDFYVRFNCKIPFLNGGLFEPLNDYDWQNIDLKIDSQLFFNMNLFGEGEAGTGILNVFDRYHFTVKEDEPLEKEVAVDPEMLGKVFENLLEVTDRKAKGAFYTPREIVHYMCQESLINYLETKTSQVSRTDIETFIRKGIFLIENDLAVENQLAKNIVYKIPESIRKNANQLDKALADVLICDPAIGSGAFPVGLMTEIVNARFILYKLSNPQKTNELDENEEVVYNLKRHCIQHSIYGVDVDNSAIDIAKLRLWLSLVVDEHDYSKIKPLPNLDYKIVCGNSLLSIEKNLFNNDKIHLLEKKKDDFFICSDRKQKHDLKEEIENLFDEITDGKKQFDFKIYFSEVFRKQESAEIKIINAQIDALNKQIEAINKALQLKGDQQIVKLKLVTALQQISIIEIEITKIEKSISNIYGEISSVGNNIAREPQNFDYQISAINNNINRLNNKIAELNNQLQKNSNGKEGGFDIVIGNPPYIQLQKNGGQLAKLYENQKFDTFARTGDIYCLFYENGIRLSSFNGLVCLITSHKWMRAGYGEKLRRFFIEKTNPVKLIDFGGYQVFDSATVDVNILLVQKNTDKKEKSEFGACLINKDYTKQTPLEIYFEKNKIVLKNLSSDVWTVSDNKTQLIKQQIEKVGTPLKDWYIKIYRGVLTGFNDAFIIDENKKNELINFDSENAKVIKPIVSGKDVKKYGYNLANRYIIFFPSGWTNKNKGKNDGEYYFKTKYPHIFGHLFEIGNSIEGKGKGLFKRDDKGEYWWELRKCAYYNEFKENKIIWGNISYNSQFCFSDNEIFVNAPANFLISKKENLKFLISIMNSKLFDWAFKKVGIDLGHAYEWKKQYVEQIPIPKIPQSEQKPFEILVDYILWLKKNENLLTTPYEKAASNYFESVINGMVYELYFEESVKKHGKDILKYLADLPELNENEKHEKSLETIMKVFFELYDEKSPVRNALYYMDSVPEVKIIEGKK